ncbi:hypothetical protein Y1Q_0006186 [Alligator mississippiensis]|uniref:Uncharacterized protein n=1 Tax=Alligator mississippiensis TaxID=8496 RepID=A0A151NWS3_ALLMI|nr:hypothetical protein Y1Q_0006186 [Alligator mississippiensis]
MVALVRARPIHVQTRGRVCAACLTLGQTKEVFYPGIAQTYKPTLSSCEVRKIKYANTFSRTKLCSPVSFELITR